MKTTKITKKKGFSLVELVVCLAVIGVIAAIAIPALNGIFGRESVDQRAKEAAAEKAEFDATHLTKNEVAELRQLLKKNKEAAAPAESPR